MPSFADVVKPDEAWDLVHYLRTLQVNHKSPELALWMTTKEGAAIVSAQKSRVLQRVPASISSLVVEVSRRENMRPNQIITAAFLLTGVAAMSFAGPPKPAGGSVSGKVTYEGTLQSKSPSICPRSPAAPNNTQLLRPPKRLLPDPAILWRTSSCTFPQALLTNLLLRSR